MEKGDETQEYEGEISKTGGRKMNGQSDGIYTKRIIIILLTCATPGSAASTFINML